MHPRAKAVNEWRDLHPAKLLRFIVLSAQNAKMRILAGLAFATLLALPAWGQQKARPVDGMSGEQRADYQRLTRSYVDTFRILGRAKACGQSIDRFEPFVLEIARRHGEKSDLVAIAALGFAAGAENRALGPELEGPAPPAPMPCDVVVYMKDLRLPDLPASLVLR